VVNGTNYLVKFRVGEGVFDFLHAKIHIPLPHTGLPPSLKGVSGNHGFTDPLEPQMIPSIIQP